MLTPKEKPIDPATFQAGVDYFMRLRRVTSAYLRGASYKFDGKTEGSKAIVRHAIRDHATATTGGRVTATLV